MSFNYLDPILSRRRKGDASDPYVDITESIQVPDGATYQLTEIPSRLDRVIIPNMVEVQIMPPQGLAENEFYVDYVEGLVTVHAKWIGEELVNTYKGTGARYFPASRVWTEEKDGQVTKTLGDIIKAGKEAIDVIEQLDELIDETNEAIENAEEATNEAHNAADRAESIADRVEAAEALRESAEIERESAESARQSAEDQRVINENQRILNEQGREDAEDDRIFAEQARESAESIRQSNEDDRILNESARQSAELDRESAETIRQSNEAIREGNEEAREDAEEARVLAEEAREDGEYERKSNEITRQSNEDARKDAEGNRILAEEAREDAESIRQANETIRQQQEQDRQINTATAIDNANQAAVNAQDLVDTSVHLGEYNPSETYKKNNNVRYQGSTWRALQDNQGIAPEEGQYWTLVAQRGVDGTGSVSSVNNKLPDQDGNVSLAPEDIGAESSSKKGQPDGYASLDATGNVPLEQLGNVEGMEMHGNEWHTEEFETVQGAQNKADAAEQNAKDYTDQEISNITPESIGAETPTGAQEKVDALAGIGNTKTVKQLDDAIGDLNDLETSNKSNLVNAVNEVFQFGNERKSDLVDALIAIGVPASTSESWDDLLSKVTGVIRATGDAAVGDVLSGKTFSNSSANGLTGTMPNRTGHVNGQSISRSGTTLRIRPPQGHYPGTSDNSVQWNDPNFIAANIMKGVSLFGLAGTLESRLFAEGSAGAAYNHGYYEYVDGSDTGLGYLVTVTGLTFKPTIILIISNSVKSFTLYIGGYDDGFGTETAKKVSVYNGRNRPNTLVTNFKVGTQHVYVNNSGFSLPVDYPATFQWFAWK